MRNIKLMADYDSFALWDEDEIDNLNPDDLPISSELKRRIHEWEDLFDATLNREIPQESGFPSEDEFREFENKGRDIWRQLREELGEGYRVTYYSQVSRSVLESS